MSNPEIQMIHILRAGADAAYLRAEERLALAVEAHHLASNDFDAAWQARKAAHAAVWQAERDLDAAVGAVEKAASIV